MPTIYEDRLGFQLILTLGYDEFLLPCGIEQAKKLLHLLTGAKYVRGNRVKEEDCPVSIRLVNPASLAVATLDSKTEDTEDTQTETQET